MIGQVPRLAKIAQMGWKSGQGMARAEGMRAAAINTARNATTASERIRANQLGNMALAARSDANRAGLTAQRYSSWTGIDKSTADDAFKWSQQLGKVTEPVATPIGQVAGATGRAAMGAMMHPAGQMALFMGAPTLMMSGGGESYQEMGQIAPSMLPPDSYQDAYAMPYGMPANPQLDEEQISKARRRAEENAALNQFYAQALQQYGGY